MLQEDKLDLKQERNMKRLLERGIASKNGPAVPASAKEERDKDSTYSSTVIKTLADTKLWKALKRNAQDWVESATIALANRIERDAKLVASLGIFAFERALQDVSRALPATSSSAGAKSRPKIFQLSDKSSYDESTASDQNTASRNLRKEFSTPQDEIKAVSAEIKQIFQAADSKKTRDVASPGSYTLPSAASLKNTARRGNARLSQAYAKQQKTKLAREKENLAQSSTRVASRLIDSAYQVQRELQVEPNQPGYKTKALREATISASKQLASAAGAGATFFFGTTNSNGGGEKQKPSRMELPSMTSAADVIDASPAAGTEGATVFSSLTPPASSPSFTRKTGVAKPVDFVGDEPYFAFKRGGPSSSEWTEPYEVEDSLQHQRPPQPVESDALPVPTKQARFVDVFSTDEQVAGGVKSQGKTAQYDSIPLESSNLDGDFIVAEFVVPANTRNGDTAMDSYARAFESASADFNEPGSTVVEQQEVENLRLVTAEIISDDDFEGAVGQAKMVENLSPEELIALQEQQELEEADQPPSLLVQLTLRSLDIVFLIVEKAVLFIPDVLAVSSRVAMRLSDVGRDGMGQMNWQRIKTKRGDKRY